MRAHRTASIRYPVQMSAPRSVRLPIQIGTSSLVHLALAACLLLPGLLFPVWGAFGVGLLEWIGSGFVAFFLSMFIQLLPFFVAAGAIAALRVAWRRRASDLVLEAGGVSLEGGRLHGLTFDAREMQSESWRVRRRGKIAELVIDLPGTSDLLLAETSSTREGRSLQDLAETVRATFGAQPDREAAAATRLLHCGNCGGEATPADEPSVGCRFCGEHVPMPDDLREKIRASAAHRGKLARRERLLSAMLRQPGAPATNRLLAIAGASMLLAWPASIAVCVWFLYRGIFDADRAAVLLAIPVPVILGLMLASMWRLTDRQALQLVTLDLGAEPPRREGEPYHCRSCGGPLSPSSDQILVECAFCGAENVLGIDLGRRARSTASEITSLEGALRERRRRRLTWAVPSAIGAAIVLVASNALLDTVTTGATMLIQR